MIHSAPPSRNLDLEAELARLARLLQHTPGSVLNLSSMQDRPLFGTTLFLAHTALPTRFGLFQAYAFQDIIHKGYIIALTHGEIAKADHLYSRVHSSCVTSETLRGCDCDCVQQLEGAFATIARKGHGILFYLMQEGRGVGYVAKARDRMLVQASRDQISTFDAYQCMGLNKDHRTYHNVAQICHLLDIKAEFTVLTNNPEKLQAMKALGLKIRDSECLAFEPSPFNLAYLASKAASGHDLIRAGQTQRHLRSALPPEPILPFKPQALSDATRFIYSASYYLPVKPVDECVLVTEEQYQRILGQDTEDQLRRLARNIVQEDFILRKERRFLRVDSSQLNRLRTQDPEHPLIDILAAPYWFQVHVYYDIVSSQEFVVLTYGKPTMDDVPVVRLQSESLFNRFPLENVDNRDKFKNSVREIVNYGVGVILLLYYDGRGAGFGAYATDTMFLQNGYSLSTEESYRKLGVSYDSRDYDACFTLLRHHLPTSRIQMVMNSPDSLVRKSEYAQALKERQIEVRKWIFLETKSTNSGHALS